MDANYFSNNKIYTNIESLKKTMLDKMNKLKIKSFDISELGYQYCLDDENDFEYIYWLTLTLRFASRAQIGALPSYNASDISGFVVNIPSLPEQRKIADCLASLDDVIAKAKDELDAWKELKKGLLQQMFV